MKKLVMSLFIILLVSLFSNTAFAEIYQNFDAEIEEFSWDYTRLDQSIIFSVNIRNILDPANYIVHLEIEPEANNFFSSETRLLGVETGHIGQAKFEYPIKTIDELTIKTWMNPPRTSGNPEHVFDEKVYHISKEKMWQEVITAIDGILLSYDVTLDENSDLDIKIYHTPTKSEPKGIRVMYSGNSGACDTLTFEVEDKPIGSFSGQKFFDRTVNLGELENPDFHIVCKLPEDKDAIINIPDLQEIFEKDLYVSETPQCYNSFCIFGSTIKAESNENIILIILGIIGGVVIASTILVIKKIQTRASNSAIVSVHQMEDPSSSISISDVHKYEQKIDPISTINDIVKFTDMGFVINSSKMKKDYPYHFEHDDNEYEIRLDYNGKLRMRLMN